MREYKVFYDTTDDYGRSRRLSIVVGERLKTPGG